MQKLLLSACPVFGMAFYKAYIAWNERPVDPEENVLDSVLASPISIMKAASIIFMLSLGVVSAVRLVNR